MSESKTINDGGKSLTVRDWFAGMAMNGFMHHQGWIGYEENPATDTDGSHRQFLMEHYAKDAYAVADAMLEARNSKGEP